VVDAVSTYVIPDRSHTKRDLWPRPSDSEVIGSLMHAIRKTRKGADTHSAPRRQRIYTNARTHRERRRSWCAHGALVLALFPFLPPRDKSAMVHCPACLRFFLSFCRWRASSSVASFTVGRLACASTSMTLPCSSTVRAYPAGMKSLKGMMTTPGGGGNGGKSIRWCWLALVRGGRRQ